MNGMSRQADGPRSKADAESAKEYQDGDYLDGVGVVGPTPSSLSSKPGLPI